MADVPSQGKPISEFDAGTLSASSIFTMSYPRAATGMSTGKISASELGEGMGDNVEFEGLNSGNKTLFGAINEALAVSTENAVLITETFGPGSTGAIITDSRIKEDSIIDVYTNKYGVVLESVSAGNGRVVITMPYHTDTIVVALLLRGVSEAAPAPVDNLPHGISPKDVITLTVPTGEAIVNAVLWGEPSNNNSGWLWALTETGATITYNTSNNTTNSVRAYSSWVNGLLNKLVVNCRNNPTALPSLGEPGSRSCSGAARKVLFNTLDIYDQNGDVLYPANCTLADFGIEE